DEVYGGNRGFVRWLEEQHQPFVLAVKSTESDWFAERGAEDAPSDGTVLLGRQQPAKVVAATLGADDWQRLSAGDGAKGPRFYDWAEVPLARSPDPDWDHRLLMRRSLTDPTDLAYYVVFAPTGTPLATLARVAG